MSHRVTVDRGRRSEAALTGAVESQQALVLVRPLLSRVQRVVAPAPGEHEVRVRLQGCGISQWHVALWEGRPWFNYPQEAGAPGHEGWGFVDALGAGVDDLEIGQRVALLSGHAYAQFDIASRDCVVPLPEELDDEPFPGEAFARTMNIFEQSEIRPGHTVAIVGAGFVGLLLTQLAADRGAHVVALSRHPFELELAESMDAEETIVAHGDSRDAERVLRASGGAGFDRVIEVVGTETAVDIAHRICAERGRLIIGSGHSRGRTTSRDSQEWRVPERIVVNVFGQSHEQYRRGVCKAIQASLEGRLDPFPLMSHTVSLGSMDRGFQLTRDRPENFVKALLLHDT